MLTDDKKDTNEVSFPLFDHVQLGDEGISEIPVTQERRNASYRIHYCLFDKIAFFYFLKLIVDVELILEVMLGSSSYRVQSCTATLASEYVGDTHAVATAVGGNDRISKFSYL